MKHQFIHKREKSTLHSFTPAECQWYLDNCNKGNRKIRKPAVLKLTNAILDGSWELTTSSIGFDVNGNLTNGQHRMAACIKANKPIKVWVTSGLKIESKLNEDSGVPRGLSDNLMFGGELVTPRFVQIGTNWYRYLNNWVPQGVTPFQTLKEFFLKKKKYIKAVEALKTSQKGLSRVGFLAACAIFAERDLEKATSFLKEVIDGETSRTTPSRKLRDYLQLTPGGGGMKITEDMQRTFYAIHAWYNNLDCPRLNSSEHFTLE